MLNNVVDCLVVGAGTAGVAAAETVHIAGDRLTILKGGDTIGCSSRSRGSNASPTVVTHPVGMRDLGGPVANPSPAIFFVRAFKGRQLDRRVAQATASQ